MKSNFSRTIASLCAVALFLIVLTGCEDPEARMAAQDTKKLIDELRGQVDAFKKKNDEAEASIKELKTSLMKTLDERIEKIEANVAANQKRVLEQIGQGVKMSQDAASGLAETSRQDSNKELKATKQMVADNMQNIRAEMASELDKVRKFMDNQLKELYPYAYQPRRLDPANPPGEQAGEAPKKADAPAAEQK